MGSLGAEIRTLPGDTQFFKLIPYPSTGDHDVTPVEEGREEQHYPQAMREVRGEARARWGESFDGGKGSLGQADSLGEMF